MKSYIGHFKDAAKLDAVTKTAVSVRDGILEYRGSEIGLTPANKVFRIYRSPATIANAAMHMLNVPVTDGHVEFSDTPPAAGNVLTAEMVDAKDEVTSTTIAVRNKLSISDELLATIETGANQLSLGYTAELREVTDANYDFEQRNIAPHHLAVVPAGRCGAMCSFIDEIKPPPQTTNPPRKESKNMNKIMALLNRFADSLGDGKQKMNEEEIKAEVLAAIPELMPEQKPAFKDEQSKHVNFADTKEFLDAVSKAASEQVKQHIQIIEAARKHLGADYQFADKSANQIMRDAIATQNKHQFADSELSVAFKMLADPKPVSQYQNFGDAATADKWDEIGNKSIGGN